MAVETGRSAGNLFQKPSDDSQKLVDVERFGHEGVGAGFCSDLLNAVMRGKHNDGDVFGGWVGLEARAQVATELIAHPMIKQDEVRGQVFDLADGKRPGRVNYGKIQLFGNYAEDEGRILVIFDDQQLLFHCEASVGLKSMFNLGTNAKTKKRG